MKRAHDGSVSLAERALEILGHAIEYLTEEHLCKEDKLCVTDPPVDAILLLMRLNREVYFECPVVPNIRERLAAFLN